MDYFLKPEQISFFKDQGYLVIPGLMPAHVVKELRDRILNVFKTGDWRKSPFNTERVLSDVYTNFPEFLDATINARIIGAIRSLTENVPILLPETAIHHQFYTGWHKDTSSQEQSGLKFQWNSDCLFLQCGFYLQDNDELGGGLTVMPGSHKTPDNFIDKDSFVPSIPDRVRLKLGLYNEEKDLKLNPNRHKIIDLKSKAGDFVIFDFRLNHRATRPRKISIENVPFDRSKIAFFNAFCNSDKYSREYLDFIFSRNEPFYQSLKLRKPSDSLLKKAQELNFIAL